MQYSIFTAIDGQRWDTIAFLAYGDALGYAPLVAANPQYRALKTFTGGEVLKVPAIATKKADTLSVPPWRR